jgi:FkbM family methyltransferase
MRLSLQLKRARKLAVALCHPRQLRALIRHGVLAGNEHRGVLAPDIRTVIDIGANRGQFALAARSRLPDARIVSFEPLPAPAAVFREIFRGDAHTRLLPFAVGVRHERRAMHVSAHDDSSSLLPVTALQSTIYPGSQAVGSAEVEVAPLGHFLAPGSFARPALLKIDVQGTEHETLLGCESLLPDLRYVYCECSFVQLYEGQQLASRIIAWLDARGFELTDVYTLDRDASGLALQADMLFRARDPDR